MKQISSLTQRWLIYGFFAILCQLGSIFLFLVLQPSTVSDSVLRHLYAPWLEYPLVSLALTVGGAVLFTYLEQNDEKR